MLREVFSSSALAKFPCEKKIERKFILGKNHHRTIYTGGHYRANTVATGGAEGEREVRAVRSMRDAPAGWCPIRKEKKKKVFEKNGCSCPFYRPEIFSSLCALAKSDRKSFFFPPPEADFTVAAVTLDEWNGARCHSPMNLSSTFSDT
jgi:hypothetical protein